MPQFTSPDLLFATPATWIDRSVIAYSVQPEEGKTFHSNFVVSRDTPRTGLTAQAYADQQLVELAKRLRGFKLIHRKETTIDTQPAIESIFTWLANEGLLKQRMISVLTRTGQPLSLTLTAKADEYDHIQSDTETILTSIRLPPPPNTP